MKRSFKSHIKRATTWILRLVVAVTVLLFLFVLISGFSAGNGPSQRRALQNVLSEFFGHPVFVHQLNNYRIFPSQEIDFQGLMAIKSGEQEPFFLVDRGVYFYQPFSLPWSDRLPLRKFWFANLMTRPGILGPYSLHLQEGQIVDEAKKTGQTIFHIKGKYGDIPIIVTIPMKLNDQNGVKSYRFELNQKIEISIADSLAEFHIKINPEFIEITDFVLQQEKDRVYTILIPRQSTKNEDPALIVTDDKGKKSEIRFVGSQVNFSDISGVLEKTLRMLFIQSGQKISSLLP